MVVGRFGAAAVNCRRQLGTAATVLWPVLYLTTPVRTNWPISGNHQPLGTQCNGYLTYQPLNLQPIWGCMYKYIMGQTELQKKEEKIFLKEMFFRHASVSSTFPGQSVRPSVLPSSVLSIIVSDFHSVSVSETSQSAEDTLRWPTWWPKRWPTKKKRRRKRKWPTWSWTWWPTYSRQGGRQ